MPLLPIDLQTLFGQTPQVGREQNVQREGAVLAQAQQGAEIAKRTTLRDSSVNELQQPPEGPEQVRIRERRRGRGAAGSRGERGKGRQPPRTPPTDRAAEEPARDPALGRHIDVTG